MSAAEERAFRAFLTPDMSCLEFGCGGSTVAAATAIRGRLVSIDSSPEWLATVRQALATAEVTADVALRHVDIGPVGEAGYPAGVSRQADWARYHSDVWAEEPAEAFDLFFVDGRFRVACFLQCVLRGRADAVILFHDYAPRSGYHVVSPFAREVFREETLSGFVRRPDLDRAAALDLLARHRHSAG